MIGSSENQRAKTAAGLAIRYFMVREPARIQTFPDAFIFEGSSGETMRHLGNAVQALRASVIAGSVSAYLRADELAAGIGGRVVLAYH